MPTEEVQRTLDRIIGAVPVLASVGDALAKAAEAVSMPSLLGKLSTSMPSASAIGEAVMVAVRDHRREAVLCAAGLGVVVSCCALTAGSSAADDAATAARALAMQAEEAQRLDARQRRQREATARATQLKLEAQAARAAARELTALASEDERMLALAIAAAAKPVAGGGSSQPSPELGDNLPNGSPTKALRFAPSALSAPAHAIGELKLRSPPTSQHASSVESDTLDISSSAGSVNGSVYGTPRERFEQTEHGH